MLIDAYDKKLLYELDKDAHTTLSKLAKKLRRSKQFVEYRMKRLENNNIILGYHAIIDASKLGFITYRLYLKLQQTTRQDEKEIEAFLKKFDNVWSIARLHGKWGYAFFVGAKTIRDLHRTWDKLMLKYKKKIKKYNLSVYAPIINYNKTFFMDKDAETNERIYGDGEKENYDETDFQIIKEYSNNARMTYLELARKIGASVNTIRYRLRKLEQKKIIRGYKLDINLEAMGYTGYRINFNLLSTEKNKQLAQYCRMNKNIYQLMDAIGQSDFEITVIVKDLYELTKLINGIQERFSNVINDYEYYAFSTIPKLSFVPD